MIDDVFIYDDKEEIIEDFMNNNNIPEDLRCYLDDEAIIRDYTQNMAEINGEFFEYVC